MSYLQTTNLCDSFPKMGQLTGVPKVARGFVYAKAIYVIYAVATCQNSRSRRQMLKPN